MWSTVRLGDTQPISHLHTDTPDAVRVPAEDRDVEVTGRPSCAVARDHRVLRRGQILYRGEKASARSNDALPALKTMMASIPPPPPPPPPPPALTRDERGALLERMALGLDWLTRQLMAPRSWKERWLPRWLRSSPAVQENAILKWATYAVDRAADFAREGQGRNGYPAEILELCRDWMNRRHQQGTPNERARWSWRLKDPRGLFGAAQAHLAQEEAKLGSYWSCGSGMGRSQWDTARARLNATSRMLTVLTMGQ